MNPGMRAHLDFVKHIQNVLGVKGGPVLQILGKMYKDMAKKNGGANLDAVALAKKAKEVFDKDGKDKAMSKYKEAVKELEKKRGAKKGSKKGSKKSSKS